MSRWQQRRCQQDCSTDSCTHFTSRFNDKDAFKRFMTIGGPRTRYGMRTGAVSPPPPGAGPRYRSQYCWIPSSFGIGGSEVTSVAPFHDFSSGTDEQIYSQRAQDQRLSDQRIHDLAGSISRVPILSSVPSSINNLDIISCANRTEDAVATSDQTPTVSVRDHVFYPAGKCLLKNRCNSFVRSQINTFDRLRLTDFGDTNEDCITLDRLPRFRFGGNRAEKRGSDKFRELTERLKRGTVPVPPPRTRHHSRTTPPISPGVSQDEPSTEERTTPHRSASFSQVDYCSDDNKYIRKKDQNDYEQALTHCTLPRLKNTLKSPKQNNANHDAFNLTRLEPIQNNVLVESTADIPQVQITPESPEKTPTRTLSNNNNQDRRRRRKGIYLSQWPTEYHPSDDNFIRSTYEEDLVCTCDDTAKNAQDSLSEINKIHEEKLKDLLSLGNSSQDEPLSPEDTRIISLEWPTSYSKRLEPESPDIKDFLKVSRSDSILRSDSLSEGEPDGTERQTDQLSSVPSDVSDNENRLNANTETTSPPIPRRYSKRPLRGPYGQMLEAEMKKPEGKRCIPSSSDLKFLEELPNSPVNQNDNYVHIRGSCNSSIDETTQTSTQLCSPKILNKRKVSADSLVVEPVEQKLVPNHQRTTSSPSKLEGFSPPGVSNELSQRLLRGSSEELILKAANQASEKQCSQQPNDTRTHVLYELYENERSYVESLEVLNQNYYEPLLKSENSTILDPNLVEEIFSQIPFLLELHTGFLEQLKNRLDNWEAAEQVIGDVFLEMFSHQDIIDSYSTYVNNWKRSRDIIKSTQHTKPAFSKFLEAAARQNNRKLALDSLLIKPIQKFPKYELLLQRLIKHTPESHPDYVLLLDAQKMIHEQLLKINCMEKEALDMEQLREVESAIEGNLDLVSSDRQYLRTDMVQMTMGCGPKKDRALFLFSDLLLITGIKRRSGTINKRTNTMVNVPNNQLNCFEGNKYKLILRVPLEECEIVRTKDDSLKASQTEAEMLNEDLSTLNQISELSSNLNTAHTQLEDLIKEIVANINRQLQEQHGNQEQMAKLELSVLTQNAVEIICIFFNKPEQKTAFEEALIDAKAKLILSGDRKSTPEMIAAVPIRKTRAGLQFTCTAPTLSEHGRDLWVCNSDGYVGQVCVLSLNDKEPAVTSCNSVCNTKIICIASVPGPRVCPSRFSSSFGSSKNREKLQSQKAMQYDSSSTSDEEEHPTQPEEKSAEPEPNGNENASLLNEEPDKLSTMWLGTEDGCILIYNANDYIRIKKNKIKLQHGSAVLAIIYFQNRVFASLANGTMLIYERDLKGGWSTNNPKSVPLSTSAYPVLKMVLYNQKIYCSSGITVIVFNPQTLEQENSMSILIESNKSSPQQAMICCILVCGNALWISLQNTAIIRCYHAVSFEFLAETNVASAATKMLSSCDDIIRQHKAACLRVTALVHCKDLLWIGTSAGVLLTMPLPHVPPVLGQAKVTLSNLTGVHHGHTGHVRILTAIEMPCVLPPKKLSYSKKSSNKNKVPDPPIRTTRSLVISGGDGCEDFRTSNISEVAGREDSTNHLLIWNI